MRPLLSLLLLLPPLHSQSATPVNWYWTTSVATGNGAVSALDADGVTQVSVNYGGLLSTLKLAKRWDGTVWALDNAGPSAEIAQLLPSSASIGTQIAIPFAHDLCVDGSSNVWVARGALWTPPTLEVRDPTGATVLGSWALPSTAISVIDMMSDPNGLIYAHAQDGLYKIDPAGPPPSSPLTTAPAGTVVRFRIDHDDNVWTLIDDAGGSRRLVRHDGNMVQLASRLIQDAVTFALDGNGYPRVLRDDGVSQTISFYDRDIVAVQNYVADMNTGTYESLAVDWAGRTWFTDTSLFGKIHVQRCDGTPHATILATSPSSAHQGDRTGLHLMTVLDPGGDADGDLIINTREVYLGADLLDPAIPPQLQSTSTTPGLGTGITVSMTTTDPPGYGYVIAASESANGFPLVPPCVNAPLSFDFLLQFWIGSNNVLAQNVVGTLDASGAAASQVLVPNHPPLVGASFFFGGVTTDLLGLPSQVAPALSITVQ